jgi:hypothetical protein
VPEQQEDDQRNTGTPTVPSAMADCTASAVQSDPATETFVAGCAL